MFIGRKPGSKRLFGNDLAKTLKDAKEANNLSSSMKRYPSKRYPPHKKPAWLGQNEQAHKHSQQNFLWKGQPRNPQKTRRMSWQAGPEKK